MSVRGGSPRVVSLLKSLPSLLDEERFQTLLAWSGLRHEPIISTLSASATALSFEQ